MGIVRLFRGLDLLMELYPHLSRLTVRVHVPGASWPVGAGRGVGHHDAAQLATTESRAAIIGGTAQSEAAVFNETSLHQQAGGRPFGDVCLPFCYTISTTLPYSAHINAHRPGWMDANARSLSKMWNYSVPTAPCTHTCGLAPSNLAVVHCAASDRCRSEFSVFFCTSLC